MFNSFEEFAKSLNYIVVRDEDFNGKVYDGSTIKKGVTINGIDYIMKLGKNEHDLSVFTEHIVSKIIWTMGYPCHDTILGLYKGENVVLVKDFTSETSELHTFSDSGESSFDTEKKSKEYTYDDVIRLIESHSKIDKSKVEDAVMFFWQMYILDAIFGNRDRHAGNWGFLIYKNDFYKMAPIYDNGYSLFPNVGKNISQYVDESTRYKFMYDRVFTIPASQFKILDNGLGRVRKTNYYEIIGYLINTNSTFNLCLNNMTNTLNSKLPEVADNVLSIVDIDPIIKEFYKNIIIMRLRCIINREDFGTVYNDIYGEKEKE